MIAPDLFVRAVRTAAVLAAAAVVALTSGCATPPPPADLSAFQKAKPASLLVLPPLNDTPDVKATAAVWAHATFPLAENGYYVIPVTLADETFRQNGLGTAADVHQVNPKKLREFFGADAAVYIRVLRYGTTYRVVSSDTVVEVEARIVDLRDGQLLWQGKAQASSAEQQQQNQGGLAGLLITALIKQVAGTVSDAAFGYAGIASQRLLSGPRANGVLPGPRSPLHGQPPPAGR